MDAGSTKDRRAPSRHHANGRRARDEGLHGIWVGHTTRLQHLEPGEPATCRRAPDHGELARSLALPSFHGWYLPMKRESAPLQDDAIRLYIPSPPRGAAAAGSRSHSAYGLLEVTIDRSSWNNSPNSTWTSSPTRTRGLSRWGLEIDLKSLFLPVAGSSRPGCAHRALGQCGSFTWEVGAERDGTIRWLPLVPAALPGSWRKWRP